MPITCNYVFLLANIPSGIKVNITMTSLSRIALTDGHTLKISPSTALTSSGRVTSTPSQGKGVFKVIAY